jgi:predicted AAA+ superfamily ATPase
MIIKEILDIIAELNFWYRDQDVGIERGELDEVNKLASMKNVALLICGVRRAGKTYLARQLLKKKLEESIKKEQTLYVNFEDKRLEPYLNKDILDNLYETYRYYINKKDFAYIVLDEIQNVEGWEKWVRMMLEKKENIKIIITGSGSKLLTPKLSSVLTGRKITYELFPLSFKDFLKFKKINKSYFTKREKETLIREYIEFGSFPLTTLTDDIEQKRYFLQEVYDDIVTKDIMFRYRLREEAVLRKVAYLVMNSFGGYISIRSIRNSLKSIMKLSISPSTLSYYLEYFERSSLFLFSPIFSYKIKEQMQYPKKVYCIDTGLINSVIPKFSENVGRLYENVVAIELKRRAKKGQEIYYWKDSKGEVDFVIKTGLKPSALIQVCYNIEDKNTKEREVQALLRAMQEFRLKEGLVITQDYEAEEKFGNKKIKFVPLWKWLLE